MLLTRVLWAMIILLSAMPCFAIEPQYAVYPQSTVKTGVPEALIRRGEYLAKAGNCISCHTDTLHNGAAYAGGLEIKTPIGIFYSSNITPDLKTGIGQWSDDDFVHAMREGRAPDGSHYFPVFPYPYFNKMSRDDILAIKVYLFSIPAVNKQNRPPHLSWLLRWRFVQWGWKLLFFEFRKGEFKYNTEKSAVWNRGAYLVQGLGQCGRCHSPHNLFGGEQRARALKGGFVQGYYAPDITSTGLKEATIDQIVAVFTKGEALGGGKISGTMAQVNNDSLQYLTQQDLVAIATYLQSIGRKPKKESVPLMPSQPVQTVLTGPAALVSLEVGKKVYDKACSVCHAEGKLNAPKMGDKEAWAPLIAKNMEVLFQHTLQGYGDMPPRGACDTCTDAEVIAATKYMVQENKKEGDYSLW